LEQHGFTVSTYNDPVLALSEFKAGLYDLLLADVRMPGMSGLELYEKIKQIDHRIEVCFITAFDEILIWQNRYQYVRSYEILVKIILYMKMHFYVI
jgi:CheY-like chemotaxis protein